jgi:hypothetical protein
MVCNFTDFIVQKPISYLKVNGKFAKRIKRIKTSMMFTEKDVDFFNARGVDVAKVEAQLKTFGAGFPFLNVSNPATINDGVLLLNNPEYYAGLWDEAIANGEQATKFVPASGAASRMFKDLFHFQNQKEVFPELESVREFFKKIEDFAFFEKLSDYLDGLNIDDSYYFKKIVSRVLDKSGLGYGQLPKGLILFHKYPEGARTPFEEHLVEAALYSVAKNDMATVHFTVSPEHLDAFKKLERQVVGVYEKRFGIKYEISYSVQKPSTDTIAVNPDNTPFRNADGTLLFRPGGHGALIENLNELSGGVVFIKNIDNVVPDHLKPATVLYKKALAGYLVQIREKLFEHIIILRSEPTTESMVAARNFIDEKLNLRLSPAFYILDADSQRNELLRLLDRPLRLCGMVKNEGEPGGGPFWVTCADGSKSLQIAEMSQIDTNDEIAMSIVAASTHFNPVDLVCSLNRYDGSKFHLPDYVDSQTGFISSKSKDGKELKALELPGLWNGAMANWNTIFVEVPTLTFNPVKTLNDLLRPQHQ